MADLTTLIAPNGSTVKVAAEKAERLLSQGYTAEKKTTSKSTSSSKSEK